MTITTIILALLLQMPIPPLGPTLETPPERTTAPLHCESVPLIGISTYYGKGLFAGVVANRVRWGQIAEDECPECLGYAAMLDADTIGARVWVDGFGPLLVVDNAAAHHRQGLIDRGWVVDLQWEVWQELGFWNAPTMVQMEVC